MLYLRSGCLKLSIMFVVTTQAFALKSDTNSDLNIKSLILHMLTNIINSKEYKTVDLIRLDYLNDYIVLHTRPNDLDFNDSDKSKLNEAVIAKLDAIKNKIYRRKPKRHDQNKSDKPVLYVPIDYYLNNFKHKHKNIILDTLKEDKSSSKEEDDNNIVKVGLNNGRRKLNIEVKDRIIRNSRRSKSFKDKCAKEAKKLCKEACKNAYRSACRVYACSTRAKKRFRTECKYSCNAKFKTDTYSDYDE